MPISYPASLHWAHPRAVSIYPPFPLSNCSLCTCFLVLFLFQTLTPRNGFWAFLQTTPFQVLDAPLNTSLLVFFPLHVPVFPSHSFFDPNPSVQDTTGRISSLFVFFNSFVLSYRTLNARPPPSGLGTPGTFFYCGLF